MGKSSPVIVDVIFDAYKKVAVEASNGMRYYSDLSLLQSVYCFPKNFQEWQKGTVDSYGLAIIWPSRFEVHVEQIIGLAYKTEPINQIRTG